MRVRAACPIALAVAVLAPCFSVALAEEAIKAGEHRNSTQADPCAAFGPGYYTLAGTETCIKIGGSVRIDLGAGDLDGDRRNHDR